MEIQVGRSCSSSNSFCGNGLICHGSSHKVCEVASEAGVECGHRGQPLCMEGLECQDGACQTKVNVGQDCSAEYTFCDDGTMCVDDQCQEPVELSAGGGLFSDQHCL